MKKCGRIGILLLSVILFCNIAIAGSAKGIVTGEAGAIAIVRNGEPLPCQMGELLYEGDILRGSNVEKLGVEWHPYATIRRIGPNEVKVVYQPPGSMDIAVYKLKEFLGFVDKESQVQYAATRGGENEDAVFFPRPGFKATIISGYPITFSWAESKGKELVIENSRNEIVFKKLVMGKTSVELRQEDINLKTGEQYTWRITGMRESQKICLADSEIAKQIIKGLKKIDSGEGGVNDKLLNKAAFLQMISDDKPESIDMYWLSYQLLSTINTKDDSTLKRKVDLLKSRFNNHLERMM